MVGRDDLDDYYDEEEDQEESSAKKGANTASRASRLRNADKANDEQLVGQPNQQQSAAARSRSQGKDKQPEKKKLFGGVRGFLKKLSKGEQKFRKEVSTKSKKLPKNFADLVLNMELKIESGTFDIELVNELLQLYSNAVEYYSGMNDEKYIYFTERIQNTLVRPEILKLMKNETERF